MSDGALSIGNRRPPLSVKKHSAFDMRGIWPAFQRRLPMEARLINDDPTESFVQKKRKAGDPQNQNP
jgi:hypothetical protein